MHRVQRAQGRWILYLATTIVQMTTIRGQRDQGLLGSRPSIPYGGGDVDILEKDSLLSVLQSRKKGSGKEYGTIPRCLSWVTRQLLV